MRTKEEKNIFRRVETDGNSNRADVYNATGRRPVKDLFETNTALCTRIRKKPGVVKIPRVRADTIYHARLYKPVAAGRCGAFANPKKVVARHERAVARYSRTY